MSAAGIAPGQTGMELSMKESYTEGAVGHGDLESCVCVRKSAGEALTEASMGGVLHRSNEVADHLCRPEGKCSSGGANWS